MRFVNVSRWTESRPVDFGTPDLAVNKFRGSPIGLELLMKTTRKRSRRGFSFRLTLGKLSISLDYW